MRIESSNKLSENQMMEILNLEKEAFHENALENHAFLSNEINFDKTIHCFYCAYENNMLVAFLTTFIPTAHEAEILAVTHSEHRRKGYFTKLFKCAKATLLSRGINKVLLAVEPKSKSGVQVLKSFQDLALDRSEYRMSYKKSKAFPECNELQFFRVNNENKEMFLKITQDAFCELEGNSDFVDTVISSENREGYIAYKGTIPIGVFDFNYEEDDTFLYGVGIASPYRRQGFGKQLIGFALTEGLKKSDKVILDVDSNNPAAFNLYKNCGFQIDFQVDYYRYKLCCNS